MPHSVSPEATPSAPITEIMESAGEEQEHATPIEDQISVDLDITMGEAGSIEDTKDGAEGKPEVKLEDLFADVESDDEFPSSSAQDIKVSSSPEAPASPMYGAYFP